MLKAIIFDMDDTLLKLNVDWKGLTEEIDVDYFNGKYPYLTPHKFFVAYFSRLLKQLTKRQQTDVRRRRLEVERQGTVTGACFPYTPVIADLSKRYKLGVVSGNYAPTVDSALSKCGLRKYMRAVISIDDCPVAKPSPEPLYMALRKLGIRPHEAVYVGDHPDDMRAGKAAGMKTIGVAATDFAFRRLENMKPDAIVKNIGQIPNVLKQVGDS
ncbi:Glyceraldehyde 3-phosphate phosphatase [uncultured archaeon]|nr:Glyceraldehyde 3-phosphate phosphatase [uncultured archaeon]